MNTHSRGNHQTVRRANRELQTIPLFDRLPEETLDSIAANGAIRNFDRGMFLFFEGDPASEIHFLIEGQVKIVNETEDGQEIILRLIQPGEIFGGAGGWGAEHYPATAVALEETRIFQLPVTEFPLLVESHAAFALAVISELGTRLREAESRIRELQAERVERRIARTLLRLAGKTGRETADGIQIDLPQSRLHLAELSGSTLSTVSRVLSEWDRQGLILAGRERVTLIKAHELVMIAEDFVDSGDR